MDIVVQAVRDQLTDDLRKPRYQGDPNPVRGHCYVASEVLYHLLGGKAHGWKPMQIKHEDEPHWFLVNVITGQVLDATSDQFESPVPYGQATGRGFLTVQPSRRAKKVLDTLLPRV
jgi:hypothetical protein